MNTDRIKHILARVEKPGRYTGGEYGELIKDKSKVEVRMAFCFPDTYEIGMSNLGMRILRHCLNKKDYLWCERCYAPWTDMEAEMRREGVPLYALESGDDIKDFDIVAFTLQYELSYTNAVNMLDLAGIPIYASERGEEWPLVIAGGPCAYNPEPMSDFIDVFSIGEGEETLCALADLYRECKKNGVKKADFLKKAAGIRGMYVPSLYEVSYNEDGTIKDFRPKEEGVPAAVEKAFVTDLDGVDFPTEHEMPYLETVHDRMVLEVFRGCIRGCRFCQAGTVCRPVREKSPETLDAQARELYKNTGYSEVSMCCLSISDYTRLRELIDKMLLWTEKERVNISLPSMRIDSFYRELMEKAMNVRQSGLTFAPEAGTQRLRDVINKNLTEEEILKGCEAAFDGGRSALKLYFMNGLPTETDDDIRGIASLAQRIVDLYYSEKRGSPKGVSVSISVSCLVPKPFTPFQWFPQDTADELLRKQMLLKECITSRKISYSYHDGKVSFLEAVFARGDRRLSAAIAEAVRQGQRFDSWDELFDYDRWMGVFEKVGIDPAFYANRRIGFDEKLPWDHISCGVSKEFLIKEAKKALEGVTTPDCRTRCSGCGMQNRGCTVCKGGEKQ